MKKKTDRFASKTYLIVAAALIAGMGLGYGLNGGGPKASPHEVHEPPAGDGSVADLRHGIVEKKALFICPMSCVPPMEKSGNCPVCGMELVEVSAQDHEDPKAPSGIQLTPESIRTAGIKSAPVERKFVNKEIKLFGKIEYDPVEQYKVTAFAPGIIDRIYVKRAGQTVRAGDPLFEMHSSELFFLEQDLFEVLKHFPDPVDYRPARGQIYKRQMRPPRRHFDLPRPGEAPEEEIEVKKRALEKLSQIRRKMMLLGLTNEDIERIMARGLPSGISTVTTPTTGVVQEQLAFKGSYVNTGETIFTIANPQYIWARLDGYAVDFPWVRLGQEAEFRVDAYPGETFTGKVIFLDPEFDPKTRTFKIGVLHTTADRRLKPNMLVRCVIKARLTAGGVFLAGRRMDQSPPLVIPDSAPLITGNRAVVYMETEENSGMYQGREVVLGPRAEGYYVVESGVQEGERVVVNGNFKLDSAVQILAKPSMMEPGEGMRMDGHVHAAQTEPMEMEPGEMEPMVEKSPAEAPKMSIGDMRRKRFSELLKSRPMKSSGRMRTINPHSSRIDQRHEGREEMEAEARESMEHGMVHQHGEPGRKMDMGPESEHSELEHE